MNIQDNAFVAQRDTLIDSILNLPQFRTAGALSGLTLDERSYLQGAIADYTVGIMAICAANGPCYSPTHIRHVFAQIANGRNNHGDFLRSFADAILRADPENFSLLRASALSLIEKYDLAKYLDNFVAGGGL